MVRVTQPMRGLAVAAQFLTRVPITLRREPDLTRAIPWFPVVGAVIGTMVGGLGALLWHWTPPLVGAAIAVLAGVLITGAFHEDGLADIADSFAGGWTIERRLEIMKDPRHGSYGVAALSGSIVLRVVALGSIASPAAIFASAVAAHTVARGAAVAVMRMAPVATRTGLGADSARSLSGGGAAAGVLGAIGIATLATGWWVAPLAGCAVVGAAAITWLAVRKIGGVSGDVLGAVEQVVECACLVVASALAARHPIWWT